MEEEKKFIHDIASPLTSIQLDIQNVVGKLKEKKVEENNECIKLLDVSLVQIKNIIKLIQERQKTLFNV